VPFAGSILVLGAGASRMKALIAIGILALVGFVLMLLNFVERPTNNSGVAGDGYVSGRRREYNPPWPPENERQARLLRKWWEL
jgi:hypothetical protein